jgi:hypothetical protein
MPPILLGVIVSYHGNQAGNLEQIIVEAPQQIADKVNHKSYDALIAAELGIDLEKLPEIKADNIRDTLLVRIRIRDAVWRSGRKCWHRFLNSSIGISMKKSR